MASLSRPQSYKAQFAIVDVLKEILKWDYQVRERSIDLRIQTLSSRKNEDKLKNVPVTFPDINTYIEVFYHLFLEEVRAQLQKEAEETGFSFFLFIQINRFDSVPSPLYEGIYRRK